MGTLASKEYRVRRGQFEAVVQAHENNYWYSVRDITRERPTIHGFGVDFEKGITAVKQLLERLEGHRGGGAESEQEAA